jgi:hypothetical protein
MDAALSTDVESMEVLRVRHRRLMAWMIVAVVIIFLVLAASLWKLYLLQYTSINYKMVFDKTVDISDASCPYSIHTLKLTNSFNANPIYFNISSIPSECVSKNIDSFTFSQYSEAGPKRQLSIVSCFTDLLCVVDALGNILSLYTWASNEQFLIFSLLALLLILVQS